MTTGRDIGSAPQLDAQLAERASRAMRPPRIVVADDDEDLLAVLSAALRAQGFDVVEARDGAELLNCVQAMDEGDDPTPAEMIIADVGMRRLTGLQALRWLRLADCRAGAILMIANPDAEVAGEAEHLGAEVVEKPANVHQVVGAVLGKLPALVWARCSRWADYAERDFGVGGDGTSG